LFDNGVYDAERQFCEAIVETQSKRLWYVTVANIVLASMSLAFVYGTALALAVLAPQVSTWPLPVFLLLGVALSVIGLKLTKPVVSRASRRAASFINGCALLFNLLIILGISTIFFRSTQERFLIPDTYKGDVYILYGIRNGQSLSKTRGEVIYRIPRDGILLTRDPMPRGTTRSEYYYERADSSLERIRNFWPTTVHPTPENLANDSDVGIFFPRNGELTDYSTKCSVQFEQFYVGTKAHLLSKYKQIDLSRYVRDHSATCLK
jgi:hypothetical protein